MISTGCIFELDKIENFYCQQGEKANPQNDTMFFQLSENGEIYGMLKMQKKDESVFLYDIVKRNENIELEEFLLKSAINLALTFDCKFLETTLKYNDILKDMNFRQQGEIMKGNVEEIDFPKKCKQ